MSAIPGTRQDRIVVVDDDARIRDLLRRYLSQEGFDVLLAEDGKALNRLMTRENIDLIVLDLMLPGEDGLSICRRLRAAGDRTPIIMLTAKVEDVDRIVGLEVGADDYLPKPFEPRELLLRVGALLRRAVPPAKSAHAEVRMGDAVYDPGRGQLRRKGKPVHLTSSESALLQLFAANAGRSFSRTDLCTRLGVALERSIDVQVTRLRRKIEEDPKLPLYLQTVRGVGYVLVPDRVT